MSPSAADVLGTSAVDPLAIAATPSAKRATAGFQEHLQRANQAAQSPLFNGRESPARSGRQDATRRDPPHAEQADDPDRAPRDQPAPASQARNQKAAETDASGPTAEADRPAADDAQSPADDATNSAAEQAAGQAGAADAAAQPADSATKEETIAVVEAELTAELTAGTSLQTATPETEPAQSSVAVGAAVEEAVVTEEASTPTLETAKAAASAQEILPAEQAAGNAAQKGPAEKAIAATEPTVEATAAVKTAKPEAAAETDDEEAGAKHDEPRESAVADAKPAGATTPVTAAVDPAAAAGDTGSKEEKRKSDDKPTEIIARSNDKPGGPDASRIDAPVRTPAAAEPAVRTSAASGGEGTTNLSQVERTRLVQRVAKAVQTAHDRGGELKLRLSPPELGSIKLEVRLHEGVMSARIETETREAQRVLNENLLVLRERLEEQNIKVERFDVDVFNPGAGGGGNAADFAEQNGDGRNESGARGGDGSREATARGETRTSDVRRPAVSADGRINVVV